MGGGHSISTVDQVLAGIQLQTSSYGGVLTLAYGTTRIAGNLVDYDDFTPIPHTTTQQVGKGGGGSTMSQTSYTYTAGIILVICQGPVTSINQVWRDKDLGSLSGYGFTFYAGATPGTVWPTWSSKHPTKAVAYAGMTNVCHAAVDLGGSGSLKNHSFEVRALLATQQDPSAPTAYDAKPDAIIPDFLSNALYGSGWDATRIGDLVTGASSYATYCKACGFVLSPAFDTQKAAAQHLQDILDATNSETVWSAGGPGMVLKVVPYGDQSITANGTTYTPNSTPIYDLTYDDFLGVCNPDGSPTGNDAITINRVSPEDVKNCVPIEFLDRSMAYNVSTVQTPEPVDASVNGLKVDSPLTLHMICRAAMASQVSLIRGQRNVYVRNQYTVHIGWKFILLEPMDLVTLTDAIIQFLRKPVRIIAITMPDESSEEQGLTVECEEWPFGTGTAALFSTQNSGGTAPNVNADPGNANTPVIFDVPALFSASGGPEVMIATSGGALWGGCEIWTSADGNTYAQAGQITAPARHGVLTATMAAGSAQQDTTSTCAVNLTVSAGTLQTVPAQTALDMQSLCWCDGELFAYQTATLTAANRYTLQTLLYRGLYGTSQVSHASGKTFVRVDAALARIAVPPGRVGQLLYIKLVSFNVWGGGKQDLSAVSAITFTPGLKVLPAPTGVTISISDTRPS